MSNQIIVGLDIGSSFVRLVVGQQHFGKDDELQIIGAIEVPSAGFSKGVVTSVDAVTSAVSSCLDKAERLSGVPITGAWVSINTPNLICEKSKGIVAVSRGTGEILQDDVDRALETSKTFSMPLNYQILHTMPLNYSVDNQGGIKSPVGMSGVRLEVESLIIRCLTGDVNNLTRAVYRAGIDINDIVASSLSASEAVLSERHKELGSAVVNIGASTTTLSVFEEGVLIHSAVFKIGSDDITKDLAICLRCPIDLADKIKVEYGNLSDASFKKDEVDISNILDGYEDHIKAINPISRKYINDVIMARIDSVFERVDKELKKIGRSGMLPAGVFLIGGAVALPGIIDRAKIILRLPAMQGSSVGINSVIGKVNEPQFLNALGLVVYGSRNILGVKNKSVFNAIPAIKDGMSWVKKCFSSLRP